MESAGFSGDHLEVQEIGDVTVVWLLDRVLRDPRIVQGINDEILSLVKDSGRKKLLLNLAEVKFLASDAIWMMHTISRRARYAHAGVILCNLCPQIQEILEITRLDSVFTICRDVQDGLARFSM
jgi:anti-sigma B factor antagonist